MARYTDPVCRLCRREGMKLFLKGDRCFKDKCAIERRNYAPGQHGRSDPHIDAAEDRRYAEGPSGTQHRLERDATQLGPGMLDRQHGRKR